MDPSSDVIERLGIDLAYVNKLADQTALEAGKLADILN
jgi:hypothetical protein